MSESGPLGDLGELDRELRDVMAAFSKRVHARRPDIRFTVEQSPSIYYASSTLLDFMSDLTEDDLAVASAVLDLQSGVPVWSIDIVTGDGTPIVEKSVSPEVAVAMVASPPLARA
jgi:hypothetical protein